MVFRRLAEGLPSLVATGTRCFHASRHSAFCSAPLAPPPSAPGGQFLSWLKGDKGRVSVPLTQPLPGISIGPAPAPSRSPPPTEVTTLPNGVRIVTEASPGPTASLGIYVNSGSIYETSYNSGSSALLECLAFKSTTHRSSLRIQKEVEKMGSSIIANAAREQMSYTIDCLKTSVPPALELLCDSITNPKFSLPEVEEQKARLLQLLGNKELQLTLLNEMLIRRAYKGGLGQPLIPDPEQVATLTPSVLHEFVQQHYTAPNIVLAGAGVDHAEIVELATPMLSMLPKGETGVATVETPSSYSNTFVRMPGAFPQANIVLAFEYKGGWRDVNGAVIMTVLTYLMGGGNSFSSGGPGKGMHSRLYTRVLNQYDWAHSCSAFNATFNDSGLVGIQGACEPKYVNDMLGVMCVEMETIVRQLTKVELDRAKRAAVSVICNALESKATSAEDIGRQFLTYGQRISGRTYVEMIEAVSQGDVIQFVRNLLRSKPSLALYGDNTDSVNFDSVLARYS